MARPNPKEVLQATAQTSIHDVAAKVAAGIKEKGLSLQQDPTPLPPPDSDVPESSPEPDVTPESSPGTEAPDQKPDTTADNFKVLRERLAEEKAEKAQLKRALEEAEAKKPPQHSRKDVLEALMAEQEPEGFEEWDTKKQMAWWAGKAATEAMQRDLGQLGVEEMRKVVHEHNLMQQLPNMTPEQMALVSDVTLTNPKLSPQEALVVAQAREPEVFMEMPPEPSGGAQVPPAHRVQEPDRSGSRREPPDPKESFQEGLQQLAGMGSKRSQLQAAAQMISSLRKGSQR